MGGLMKKAIAIGAERSIKSVFDPWERPLVPKPTGCRVWPRVLRDFRCWAIQHNELACQTHHDGSLLAPEFLIP